MIRLTLMKEWFDRVDAERRSPIAEQLAAPWFAAEAEAVVRCGPASSNIVCRVTMGGHTYYLRCNHESERTGDDIGSPRMSPMRCATCTTIALSAST